MANAIKYGKLVKTLTGEAMADMPVVMAANAKYDFSESMKSGNVVYVSVPDSGTVVIDTDDVTSADMDIKEIEVPITLKRFSIPAALTSKELALDVDDKEEQIAKPRAAHIADAIQSEACSKLMLGAETAVVVAAVSACKSSDLSDAVATIRNAKSTGELMAGLNPTLVSKYAEVFGNQQIDQNSDMYDKFTIGNVFDCEWKTITQFTTLSTGTASFAASANVAAVTAEGAVSLVVTDSTLTSASTFKAGEIVNLAAVYQVDKFGDSIGELRAFVIQSNVSATAGAVTLTVQPIYFTGAGKNVNGTTIGSGTVISKVTAASSNYLRGVVWEKNMFCRGTAKLGVMPGTEAASSNYVKGGISLRVASQGNIVTDKFIIRIDGLYGFAMARGKFAKTILVKV